MRRRGPPRARATRFGGRSSSGASSAAASGSSSHSDSSVPRASPAAVGVGFVPDWRAGTPRGAPSPGALSRPPPAPPALTLVVGSRRSSDIACSFLRPNGRTRRGTLSTDLRENHCTNFGEEDIWLCLAPHVSPCFALRECVTGKMWGSHLARFEQLSGG